MKLRIKGNSIRLRLTKSEVSHLVETGKVKDQCVIMDNTLIYQISKVESEKFDASLKENILSIFVPQQEIMNWDENEIVSLKSELENGLSILIEKDFKCLIERENEDTNDMYENPQAR